MRSPAFLTSWMNQRRSPVCEAVGACAVIWPSSAAVYLPNNRVPAVGEVLKNSDWAATMKKVVDVEHRERSRGREGAIQAAIDYWYQGEPAQRMVEFMRANPIRDASGQKNRGLLTLADFAAWKPKIDLAVTINYHGLDVYKCGPWTQGPVFLQYSVSSIGRM